MVRMLPCHLASGETGSVQRLFKYKSNNMYYVYILESLENGDLYKGSSENYLKRFEEHNSGKSDYTRNHRPWKLIFVNEFADKKQALIQEKKLKRSNKEYLIWLTKQAFNMLNK